MTAFARSDVISFSCIGDSSKIHERKKGADRLEINCPSCEAVVLADPRFADQFAKTVDSIPLTPDEKVQAERELEEGTQLQKAAARALGERIAEEVVTGGRQPRGRGRARTAAA